MNFNPVAYTLAGMLGLGASLSVQAGVIDVITPPTLSWEIVLGDGSVRTGSEALVASASGAPGWTLRSGSIEIFDGQTKELEIHNLFVQYDPDPFINAAVSLTDFGAPTTFLVLFGAPMILASGPFNYTLEGQTQVSAPRSVVIDIGEYTHASGAGIYTGGVNDPHLYLAGTTQKPAWPVAAPMARSRKPGLIPAPPARRCLPASA